MDIQGKYGIVKVFTDNVDQETLKQIYNVSCSTLSKDSIIRLMPDVHAGKAVPIGFTQRLDKNNPRICPNLVSVDIGCRVSSICLSNIENLDFEKIDKWIRSNIPLGSGGYLKDGLSKKLKDNISKEYIKIFDDCEKLIREDGKDCYNMKVSMLNQLFSIGSGNHFISINLDPNGNYWLTIHCGSRNAGLTVANIYQKRAIEECEDKCNEEMKYLDKDSKYFNHYLECVNACQIFSKVNHHLLFMEIGSFLCENFSKSKNFSYDALITTLHNYIDIEDMIIRKGAISAKSGEYVLIPFNMRDGIAVAVGKGNEDFNYSAPHGAGRIMSRSQARKNLDLEKVKLDMKNHNVFTTSLDYALDEAAEAYKDMNEIIKYVEPTVDIKFLMKEVYNIKGK